MAAKISEKIKHVRKLTFEVASSSAGCSFKTHLPSLNSKIKRNF